MEFQLDAPNGNFPFLVSSDNYNAIILPKTYDGDWEKTFIGTGPWKRSAFRPGEGVSYVPNREYWDKARIPISDESEVRFYSNEQSEVFGLLGNEVDVLVQFSVAGGKALLTDPDIRTIELRASAHRQVHLNNSTEQFKDKRTRQAMALLVNRRDLVDGLLDTKSDFGNDSPFAPVFPSTAKEVAQRQQDVRKAKELLAAAGQEDGFQVQLAGWNGFEMPDLAQLIQQNVRQAGITINLNITDSTTLLRRRDVRQLALARLGDGHHRVRAPRRAERAARRAAALEGDLERRALQEPAVRQPRQGLHGRRRPRRPAALREADPGAAARREPDPLHLLLLLPHGREERHRQHRGDGDGPLRPEPRRAGEVVVARFIGKRILLSLITLFLLSLIVFIGAQVLPGDVGRSILGPLADQRAVDALNERLGANEPLISQYFDWIGGLLTGDMGTSLAFRRPISDVLGDALVNSLKLAIIAFIIVVPLSILGGVYAALNEGSKRDRFISLGGLSATAVPDFVWAVLLILVFSLLLPIFPATATAPPGSNFFDQVYYLILPACCLVFVLFGYIARMARAGTTEALDADYTRTAIIKGLPRRTVVRGHVLRNSLLPTIAVVATQAGYLLGGLLVIETIFNYQGIGQALYRAATQKDFPLLETGVLVVGVVYLVATLIADIAYSILNPRVRLGG